MVATRAEKQKAIFDYVVLDVMQLQEEDTITKALRASKFDVRFDYLLRLDKPSLQNISYKDDEGVKTHPPQYEIAFIHMLQAWNSYLLRELDVKEIDWMEKSAINEDSFREYRVAVYNPNDSIAPTSQATTSQPTQSNYGPHKYSLAQEFRKGIKRDKSHYVALKIEKQWDDWKRKTVSTIHAHNCANVINPSYTPSTPEEKELFLEQNTYLYDVLNSVLQTTMGKHYVRQFESSRNAQKVWSEFDNYMRHSTRGDIELSGLLSDLTSLRLSSNYRGTTQDFIADWMNKLRRYEQLTPLSAHFPDPLKKTMLQNAIDNISAFRTVKTNEQLEIAKGRGPLSFPVYVTLLRDAATIYDENISPSKSQPRRLVNMHETDHGTVYEYEDEAYVNQDLGVFDDSYNFHTYAINEASRKPLSPRRRPSLRRELWNKLSREDQMAWDKLSDFAKWTIILSLRSNPLQRSSLDQTKPPSSFKANLLETQDPSISADKDDNFEDALESLQEEEDENVLVNSTRLNTPLQPGDIRRVLSKVKQPGNQTVSKDMPSKRNYNTNMHNVSYTISSNTRLKHDSKALIDRGANGGLAGDNVRVIAKSDRTVDVSGIDNHEMNNLAIVSVGGVVNTQRGEVIAILNQFARNVGGKTLLSCVQLESHGITVDDKSSILGIGTQTLQTPEGYTIPLTFHNGLPYMDIRPFTNSEWDSLPHIILTSNEEWDPANLDHDTSAEVQELPDNPTAYDYSLFDARGFPTQDPVSVVANLLEWEYDPGDIALDISSAESIPKPPDYLSLRKYFLNAPVDVLKHTFQSTTQYARSGWITGRITNTFRSPFPAMNVPRRQEAVATDTIYSDTPAIDNGSTCAQFYVGVKSKFCDVFGMKSDSQFANSLFDIIRMRGAMDTLISDRAQSETSRRVQDILRHLFIKDWQSEPHFQHQNPAERRYKHVKHNVNAVLNLVGAPAYCWLLCIQYVCFIMNRMAVQSLKWRTPFEVLHGVTPDISMIYRFQFYDKVYYKRDESRGGRHFPSESDEMLGRFVGFSEHVGHQMTYKILTDDTLRVIHRSRIKLASISPNLRIDNGISKDINPSSGPIQDHPHHQLRPMPTIAPNDLIGRTYLTDPEEDGTQRRIKIVTILNDMDQDLMNSPDMIEFKATTDDGTYEEVLTYNQIIGKLEKSDGEDNEWHFKSITDHEGPIPTSSPKYKGSSWNVLVNWENGESTWEPLAIIAKSDPVTVAIYGKENNLLQLPGWRKFNRLANRQKKLLRMANQAKLKSYRTAPIFKFGVQVPRNHKEAMQLDEKNGNTLWADAEARELNQIDEYGTFRDVGKGVHPRGYKKISAHLVYDIKPDLRRKARLVAGGHLTETPVNSIYSSVVSLTGLKITIFLAELNQMEIWATDVGNAYLEALTEEKVYIVAGPEFGDRHGHSLIVVKAIYGLKSSGLRWWERCSVILKDMNFFPSKAEDDIWMRDCQTHYEYIARYVDDLAIASHNPQAIIDDLKKKYQLKLKGSGPIKYHLGSDFYRDKDNTLCMSPLKYIDRMMESYLRMFGTKPKATYSSPIERGDHPELDTTEELDMNGIKQYQSMIGALQWLISLGRLDIATTVMSLSSFRAAPRKGHLDRVKRIYGYISKMRHAAIRFRTGCPDYSDISVPEYSWETSIYGNMREILPKDCPKPHGPPVIMTSYVDANLCHDMTTGRAVTGTIHLLNQTVISYYTKKQPVVETATYGSEYMAARIVTEQIMEIRTSLRYLGVNLEGATYLFGDNKTVVDSSRHPKSRLHKRHVLLSFHRVREAIAAKVLHFIFIPGPLNPADILSKHWGYQQVKNTLKALLFWQGDTIEIKE